MLLLLLAVIITGACLWQTTHFDEVRAARCGAHSRLQPRYYRDNRLRRAVIFSKQQMVPIPKRRSPELTTNHHHTTLAKQLQTFEDLFTREPLNVCVCVYMCVCVC